VVSPPLPFLLLTARLTMSSFARFAFATVALFGVVGVSAIPLDAPELAIRAPAAVITKCTRSKTVALTYEFH
jgi:hypothetical protein